jgi:tRNA(Leu) C34 or U34 (ribose-2'-O)-methylase TrmL
MIEIALYQPDIAPNAATIARLCACFGLKLTIIEPAGFVFSDSAFKRAGMDYLRDVQLEHASSWEAFRNRQPHSHSNATWHALIEYSHCCWPRCRRGTAAIEWLFYLDTRICASEAPI